MEYATSAVIEAPPEAVWSILIDLESWPTWDSAVARTEGRIAQGQRIKLWPEVDPKRGFGLRVTEVRAPTSLTFEGGMPFGLFKGVRTYRLTPQGNGDTTFEMREEYSGALLRLIGRTIPDLQPSFDTFARGLKQQAESAAQP